MKIVILGANGMLGTDLQATLKDHELVPLTKAELDITNEQQVATTLARHNPDVVINAAAYTDVDGCESNKDQAQQVNGIAPGYIAKACKTGNILLLHISTDYVFDGKKESYNEDDQTNPLSEYGKSKLLGEKNVVKNCDKYCIVRTAALYGKAGKNFVNTMLTLARSKKEIPVVTDQVTSPTYTKDLAQAIKQLIEDKPAYGIFHLTNSDSCTWHDFAKYIFKVKNLPVTVLETSSEKFIRPATRPSHSVLNNNKTNQLRDWRQAVTDYIHHETD